MLASSTGGRPNDLNGVSLLHLNYFSCESRRDRNRWLDGLFGKKFRSHCVAPTMSLVGLELLCSANDVDAFRQAILFANSITCADCRNPVAITDTLKFASRLSSYIAPTVMSASELTSSRIRVAASSTSNKVISRPAETDTRTPLAPRRDASPKSGFSIAAFAAAVARP
ncbi:hypothetical protein FBZ98_10427 [Rhizobium sp. ERR 922]|nr:hypothetical protein FBZ98_10427 [Rhizobium sp. ERR 922]TWB95934.1 hypothetical protein FBZ97_104623 [Rhizobium sp. ERR 942]